MSRELEKLKSILHREQLDLSLYGINNNVLLSDLNIITINRSTQYVEVRESLNMSSNVCPTCGKA